jgi:hypothetical protein
MAADLTNGKLWWQSATPNLGQLQAFRDLLEELVESAVADQQHSFLLLVLGRHRVICAITPPRECMCACVWIQ